MTSSIRAEVIRGRVIDAETREALPNVNVSYTIAYTITGYSVDNVRNYYMQTDSLGCFKFHSCSYGKITARLIGYHPADVTYLAFSDSKRDTVDVGDIELKMSEKMMKALEVKERAQRMTMSGDTVVFHPEAFHLEEGARLEDLIKELPGVEVWGDGSLRWYGSPIRILLEGESFLGDNREFYDRIPVEAIEKINVYNMKSEFSERTGKDDGKWDMVLDLKIRKSFLDKFYGDVKAAYQTWKDYDADVQVNRLSKTNPVMLTVTANSLNKRHRRTVYGFRDKYSELPGEEQYGAAGYQHRWVRKEGRQWLRSHWEVGGGLAHDDNWENNRKDTESFHSDNTTSYKATMNHNRKHELLPHAQANYQHAINARNTVNFNAEFEYAKTHGREDYHSAKFDSIPENIWSHSVTEYFGMEEYLGEHVSGGLLWRQRMASTSGGDRTKLNATGSWTHYVKKGSLGVQASVGYSDEQEDWSQKRMDEYFSNSIPAITTERHGFRKPESKLEVTVVAKGGKWIRENVLLDAQYTFQARRDHLERDYFRKDITDAGNSYDEHYIGNDHTLRVASTINLPNLQIMPEISMNAILESDDYVRGSLDTVAVPMPLYGHRNCMPNGRCRHPRIWR